MGRTPCCDKNGLKKGPWTSDEDQKLIDYIHKHGYGNWRYLPKNAGLQRCGKSCRLRWTNYLRPDIKRGRFSFEEEEAIIQLHSILGNKWSAIAARLPGRTDNEIKNYWNTHIRKRLLRMGIDPVTHASRLDLLDLSFMNIQSRLLGLQTMVNPELLKLATSFILTQVQNPSSSLIKGFNNSQMQNNFNSIVQSTQIQNPVPNCTTMTTICIQTEMGTQTEMVMENFKRKFGEAQLLEPNFEEYPTNYISSFDYHNLDPWQSNSLLLEGLDNIDPTFMEFQQSFMNFAPTAISTPSSSLTSFNSNSNSNSMNVSSNGKEDERESYCSDVIKFEIPDIVDVNVNQLLLSENNCS